MHYCAAGRRVMTIIVVLVYCCVVRCVRWSAEKCIDLPHVWLCLQHVRPVPRPLVAYSKGNVLPACFFVYAHPYSV